MSGYVQYFKPAVVDTLVNFYNVHRADTINESSASNAKKELFRVALAIAGTVAFIKFGSRLGDYRNVAALLLATAFAKTSAYVPFVASLAISGPNGFAAFKAKNYVEVAKNAGFILGACTASSSATREFVATKIKIAL